MQLTQDQQAIAVAFTSFLLDTSKTHFVIQGYAGCGKTFLTNHLIKTAYAQKEFLKNLTGIDSELNIALTATTHKAAAALANATSRDACTIHSLLRLSVQNNYKNGTTSVVRRHDSEVIYNTLIFVDEASMMDFNLLDLLNELTMDCKIVFIMDPKQLLPLYHNDCPVSLKGYETHTLSEVVRQAKGNPIIEYAEQLREAMETNQYIPEPPQTDQIKTVLGPEFKEAIVEAYTNRAPTDLRVLAWSNARVNQYNEFIQNLLYPGLPLFNEGMYLVSNKTLSSASGKILLANEEVVKIEYICPKTTLFHDITCYSIRVRRANSPESVTLLQPVNFDVYTRVKNHYKRHKDWGAFFALENEVADLRPIFSSTVHKAQGSTFETVFIDVADICRNHKINEVLRLLYVAITRASKNVLLYGNIPEKYK